MGIAVLTLTSWAAAAPCADPAKLVQDAMSALAGADFTRVEGLMGEIDAALACGDVADPKVLGKMWLVEGTWLFYQEDVDGAKASFAAAARVAPGLWTEAFGEDAKAVYDVVAAAPSPDTVEIRGENTDGWYVAIDGLRRTLPTRVERGVHVFQVGATADDIRYGKVADVPTSWTLKHGLGPYVAPKPDPIAPAPTPIPQPTPVPVPPTPRGPRPVGLHLGIGGTLVLGEALGDEEDPPYEPATKLLLPIEVGLRLQPVSSFWMRFCGSAAPVLNGQLLYQPADEGVIKGSFAGIGGAGGLGGTAGPLDIGVLGGITWPGRLPLRGLVAYRLGKTGVRVEADGGLNLGTPATTGGPPRIEPSVGLLVTLDPLFVAPG